MYENYYGLTEKPFSLLPDPEYLFLSRHHQKALTLLEYGIINQAGFCVISGQAGAGKTTLIRYLLTRLDKDTTVGLLSNTHKSFEELLAWILLSFDLPYQDKSKTERYQIFVDFLIEQYAKKHHTVLIIDEAQNMSPAALEELRMLSNINADKNQLLQMILMGQPGLLKNLQRPQLRQFAQRIAVDYKLEVMNKVETCAYIRYRLKVAGTTKNIFNNGACIAVYYHSQGLPRLINLLCDTALVYGYAENMRIINEDIINDVVKERDENTILPHYHELSEAGTFTETKIEEQPGIIEEHVESTSSVVSKMTSCGETTVSDEPFSGPKLITSQDDKTTLNEGMVLPAGTVSITSLKQASYFSKAMNLQKEAENSNRDKEAGAGDDCGHNVDSDASPVDNKVRVASADKIMNRKPGVDEKPERATSFVSRKGIGRSGFIIFGFAFGLLMSVAILILYKMDNRVSPSVNGSQIEGKMKELENNFAHKLQLIQQQREADREKSRITGQEKDNRLQKMMALQHKQDMALIMAKASAELLRTKLKAERSLHNERLAMEKASLAFARARAAWLNAKLNQKRKMDVPQSISSIRPKAEQTPVEPRKNATIDTPAASPAIEKPATEAVQTIVASPTRQKLSDVDKQAAGFQSNPCEGPTAVLLSTCKK